ncbi:MAG: DUF4129 domain-containing protein, partial [Gemmata sp.]
VARISIQFDRARASLYGACLAAVTYLALLSYVEYPSGWLKSWGWLVNLGLLGVVWWSAHKLTWDCTHIDEKENSSGRGLLNAAGLDADRTDGRRHRAAPVSREPEAGAKGVRKKRGNKKSKHDSRLWDWIEKYQAHREAERKRGHTPGVWVLYFALAALPLFALGQSLIDPADAKRRENTFLQMAVYIGSALGLLVTTSLLGVRRYLRQRKAKVPGTMAAAWLGLGGVLIAAFLVLGAFLPRPHSEVPWFGIERAGAGKRDASKYAQLGDSPGAGAGRGGNKSRPGDGGSAKGGKDGDGDGDTADKGSGGKRDGGKGGGGENDAGGNQKGKGKGGSNKGDTGGSSGRDSRASVPAEEEDDAQGESGSGGQGSEPGAQPGGTLETVARLLKWVVFAAVAVLIILGLFLGVLRYLAPFTEWARRLLEGLRAWWAGLFGGAAGSREASREAAEASQGPVRPPPFSAYSNPFSDGTADQRPVEELVAYSFEALDAWAWDRAAGRAPAETPLEFARRAGDAFPDRAGAFAELAAVYTRATYSDLPLPDGTLALLEDVWEQMVHGAAVGA